MRSLLTVVLLLLGVSIARADCVPPPTQPSPDGINFILGIDPSDGILDVWCRVQSLQGEYKVSIFFIEKGAKKSFTTTFDGTPSHDRLELATFIQSALPQAEAPALDADGMNFGSVLETAVQVRNPKTPVSKLLPLAEEMGVPDVYEFANDLILWTPVTMDISPVRIAGVDFTLRVSFRPSFGRYLMAKNGLAEGFVVRGWHRNVLAAGSPARDKCPPAIPACKDFGDVIDLNTAWTFNSITLHAAGKSLSAAAQQLFDQIVAENDRHVGNPMKNFSPTTGQISFDVTGGSRVIRAAATGAKDKVSGTTEINVRWEERPDSKLTYIWTLRDYARRVRDAMVMANPSQD